MAKSWRMRAALTAVILAVWTLAGSEGGKAQAGHPEGWLTNWDEAVAQAKTSGKPIIAVFSAEWCGPCQFMNKQIYPQPEVKKELENWIHVYLDEAEQPAVHGKFGIEGYPTTVFLSAAAAEEDRFSGALPQPAAFVERLQQHPKYMAELKEIKAGLAEHPDDPALLKRQGDAFLLKDKVEEATAAYRKAAANDPEDKAGAADDAAFWTAMPRKRTDMQSSREKLTEFGQKFPASPLASKAAFYRAIMTAELGDLKSAKSMLEEAMKTYPDAEDKARMQEALGMVEERLANTPEPAPGAPAPVEQAPAAQP